MELKLVKNDYTFWEFIRNLRNAPGTKESFIEQEHIEQTTHERFMKKHSDCYFICLSDETPVGFIGVIEGDIRVAVSPEFQGVKIGSYMVSEMAKHHPTAAAKVKIANEASLRLFESCGYKRKYYILER